MSSMIRITCVELGMSVSLKCFVIVVVSEFQVFSFVCVGCFLYGKSLLGRVMACGIRGNVMVHFSNN